MKHMKFHLAAVFVILSSIWGSVLNAKFDPLSGEERLEVAQRISAASMEMSSPDVMGSTSNANRFAQWYNWGNWSNWSNWRNWLNW